MRVTEEQYAARFPLDTPGRMYDNIAGRIRAGETERDVLHDFGMFTQDECAKMKHNQEPIETRALSMLQTFGRTEYERGFRDGLQIAKMIQGWLTDASGQTTLADVERMARIAVEKAERGLNDR